MTAPVVNSATYAGTAPTYNTIATNDTFPGVLDAIIHIKVTTGTAALTINCFPDVSAWGASITDLTYSAMATSAEKWLSVQSWMIDPATGAGLITAVSGTITMALIVPA